MKRFSTRNSQLATFFFFLLFALPSFAVPSIERKGQEELQDTLEKLKASRERTGQIRQKAGKIEKELAATQTDATRLARRVQEQEGLLSEQEGKIAILEAQRKEKLAALQRRRLQLSRALSAMIRLSDTPGEAVIAQPGALEKTLQTAEALGLVTQSLRKEADSLNAQIREIEELKSRIKARYREAAARRELLSREQKKLSEKVEQGRNLREKLYRDEQRESEAVAELSKKSQSLQELLSTLEENRRRRSSRTPSRRAGPPDIEAQTPPTRSLRLPAQGRLVQRFGEQHSRGLLIATRSEAQIVAPGSGEIVFTGPFMDYGRMVIIRHDEGLHTLIAGLGTIDVVPGDRVSAGEPLGRMGPKNAGNRLYLELRKDNRPVDPAPWLR